MNKIILLAICFIMMKKTTAQEDYSKYAVYRGKDLGLTYTKQQSAFRIWSPVAAEAELLLYKEGSGGDVFKTISLTKGTGGTWFTTLKGDWKGIFYAFRVKINDKWSNEVPDPYAKATGINGLRAMVVDLKATNPAGWLTDKSPAFSDDYKPINAALRKLHKRGGRASKNSGLYFSMADDPIDAVIYELHIRDASIAENSGIKNKGKYLGLAETATKSKEGLSTGLDHLKELGVTHVHLLPFFDYASVDESQLDKPQYNWGYDPQNYNVPEGSYSSDPSNGAVRIKELKQMVAAFHKNGLRIVMDVVYNHVSDAAKSNFNQLVPGYYFRHRADGSLSDATACGNETASEMPMMRKFMLESLAYWVNEYHIDGFRIDLMGVHDIETMNMLSESLHMIKPDIILYGEGWTAGDSPLPDSLRAIKKNAFRLQNIAVFSDDIRDGIKGSVFKIDDRGFVSGKEGMEESIKFGITAACGHPQVDLSKVNYSKTAYSRWPGNVITYCECHDNNTLWDKLSLSCPNASHEDLVKMHELALTIVLTSQGTPFLHAGTEFLRTKKNIENSFNAGDSINEIDWSLKEKNNSTFQLVKQLIKLRKEHPAFRMTTNAAMKKNILFDTNAPEGTVVYMIDGAAVKDKWKNIFVAFNGTATEQLTHLPAGKWSSWTNKNSSLKIRSGKLSLDKYSALILYKE